MDPDGGGEADLKDQGDVQRVHDRDVCVADPIRVERDMEGHNEEGGRCHQETVYLAGAGFKEIVGY